MPKRGDIPWAEIKAAYAAGESIKSISERLQVRRATIQARRDREAWTVQPTVHVDGQTAKRIQREAQSKVIDLGTRQAVKVLEGSGVIDDIAADLAATVAAGRLAAEYTLDILRRAKNGEIVPAGGPGEQTAVDVYDKAMSGYRKFTATVRENAGKEPGQPSVGADEASKTRRIIFAEIDSAETA